MEEFLKVINKFLEEERKLANSNCKSFFVEHKEIIPNSAFKAIKDYIVTIYIVKQDKTPIVLFKSKTTFNSSKEAPEDVYNAMKEDIVLQFLKLIKDFEWVKIINGNFESRA